MADKAATIGVHIFCWVGVGFRRGRKPVTAQSTRFCMAGQEQIFAKFRPFVRVHDKNLALIRRF
jgi:hypothetical protein